MTHTELRLELLKVIITTGTKMDLTKDECFVIAEKAFEFCVKETVLAPAEQPKRLGRPPKQP